MRPDEEQDEAKLWSVFKATGSPAAREALFVLYQSLANRIARRHLLDRRGVDFDLAELRQWAYVGLLEALDRFDPGFGAPFAGFAASRISGSVLDGISRSSEVRQQIAFRNRVRRERARSLAEPQAMGASNPLEALADLAAGLAIGFMLEETGFLGGEERRDLGPTPYESLAWRDMLKRVVTEMSSLPERERAVVRHHYLEGLTFEVIGAAMGVTKGRISQIHKGAIRQLRERLTKE